MQTKWFRQWAAREATAVNSGWHNACHYARVTEPLAGYKAHLKMQNGMWQVNYRPVDQPVPWWKMPKRQITQPDQPKHPLWHERWHERL